MKFQSLLLLLTLAVIAAFSALNWGAINTPTELSLGFTSVQMPLGLIMLGLLVLLTLLFLAFIAYLETSALLEMRRQTRELRSSRDLADQAEASRFTELRQYLEAELAKVSALQAQAEGRTMARVSQLDEGLRAFIDQTGNSLAASIGELEDRVERSLSGGHRP